MNLYKKTISTLIATWFGSGLLRPASGTWGTLAALPFAYGLMLAGGAWALGFACIVILPLGLWAAREYTKVVMEKDSSKIVVDEVLGVWIALLSIAESPTILGFCIAFVLFRFFDITKIWPANWADKSLGGAWGVMIDDVIAGVYAGILTWGIVQFL